MKENSLVFLGMSLTYQPLACIYFMWMWRELHNVHANEYIRRSRTGIYFACTAIGFWSFGTVPLSGLMFPATHLLALLCMTGLLSSGFGWWLFSRWVIERPASAQTFLRSSFMRHALHLGLFGSLVSLFLLALLSLPPFRLAIAHAYIFGEWSPPFFIVPILLVSQLTISFLWKSIHTHAANRVKM